MAAGGSDKLTLSKKDILEIFFDTEDDDADEDLMLFETQTMFLKYFQSATRDTKQGLTDVLDRADDLSFFKKMHISRACFDHMITILNLPATSHAGRTPITKTTTLYIGLWYLTSSSPLREISELFNVTESSTHRCLWRVIETIKKWHTTIKWPKCAAIDETAARFQELSGFPGIIGAVGSTQIKILPPVQMQSDYLDRNKNYSMTLLAVCDSSMRLNFAYAGFPGCADEQRALSCSELWQKIDDSKHNDYFPSGHCHIVGDSAFALMEHVMVPYKDDVNLTAKQENYNSKLSQSRVVIENCFALLKGRFSRLSFVKADLARIPDIIMACCMIHNIALDFPDLENVESVTTDTIPSECSTKEPSQKGINKREEIATLLSNTYQ